MRLELDGEPIDCLARHRDHAPAACSKWAPLMARVSARYLAVHGGFDVPSYMGSRATFTLGQFGGHAGRALRNGDVLRIGDPPHAMLRRARFPPNCGRRLRRPLGDRRALRPARRAGFLHRRGHRQLLQHGQWQVHYNSSRTGVRLIGPKPAWARRDGGEAGLHPSNIHDNAYAIGAIDFTGDMPVILGSRRTESRRLCLPGNHRTGGSVEDRTTAAGRSGALSCRSMPQQARERLQAQDASPIAHAAAHRQRSAARQCTCSPLGAAGRPAAHRRPLSRGQRCAIGSPAMTMF